MKQQNQKGFSAIESMLSAIIVLLIVFVGYYIYHAQSKTTDTYNSSTEVAQNVVAKNNKPAVSKTLTIQQWDVEGTYNEGLTLSYIMPADEKSPEYIQLASDQKNCTQAGDAGTITRYAPTDHVRGEDGSDEGTASANFSNLSKNESNGISHIGNYYYVFAPAQARCSGSPSMASEINKAGNSVVNNIKSLN